jgi:hypothetical protein
VIGIETGPNTGVFQYTLPTTFSDKGISFDTVFKHRDKVDISLTDCLDAEGNLQVQLPTLIQVY